MSAAPAADNLLQDFLESAYLPELVQPMREQGLTCAADIDRELDRPGSDLVEVVGLKHVEEKRLRRRLELAIVRYRVLRPSTIRIGVEKDSQEAGQLVDGEELVALEHAKAADGTDRVRFDRGWVSLVTAKGAGVLEKISNDQQQPSGMMADAFGRGGGMMMQNNMSMMVTMPGDSGSDSGPDSAGDVHLPSAADLFAIMACCCCKWSLYSAFPECLGCTTKGELCCYSSASQCRMSLDDPACYHFGGTALRCHASSVNCLLAK